MPIGRTTPTLKIAFYWRDQGKNWRVESVLSQGSATSPITMTVDSGEPLTKWHRERLLTAIRREMESWLPYAE